MIHDSSNGNDCSLHSNDLQELVILGVTHRSADSVGSISSLVIPEEEQPEALSELQEMLGADELVYISTCNRASFIIISERKPSVLQKIIANWFVASRGCRNMPEAENWVQLRGTDALNHLLLVASSVDSMVVGERQILGQFKHAFIAAREMKRAGPKLNFLFEQILKVAKLVYGSTELSKGRLSVVSLAEEKINEFSREDRQQKAVLVGAGKMIELVAEYLTKNTRAKLVFVNRTLENASEMAKQYGGRSISLTRFIEQPENFDILVSSTAAPHQLFDAHFLGKLPESRRLLIDLAVPADVDPLLDDDPDVLLVNMEVLRGESDKHRSRRQKAIKQAESIIDEGVRSIVDRWKIRTINPAIGALRRKYEQESVDHLNKLFETKLSNLDENSKDVISTWAQRMAKHWAVAHAAGIKQTARNCCMKAVMSYLDGSGVERTVSS